MSGEGHMFSGSILMVDTYLCYDILSRIELSSIFRTGFDYFDTLVNPMLCHDGWFKYPFFVLSVFFYYIGLLIPDIDSEYSMISKMLHFHIPVAHRGLTHSVWAGLIFLVIGVVLFYPLRFLFIGLLIHGFIDHFSKAGWVPFYPIGKYRIYNNTVFTNKKHMVFYSAKAPEAELIFNGFILLFSIVLIGFSYYLILM